MTVFRFRVDSTLVCPDAECLPIHLRVYLTYLSTKRPERKERREGNEKRREERIVYIEKDVERKKVIERYVKSEGR